MEQKYIAVYKGHFLPANSKFYYIKSGIHPLIESAGFLRLIQGNWPSILNKQAIKKPTWDFLYHCNSEAFQKIFD